MSVSGTDFIRGVYSKAEQKANKSKVFDLKTLNSLILFINREIYEIRDELKSEVISNIIIKIYMSDKITEKMTKINESDRSKFTLFINNCLISYINVLCINTQPKFTLNCFSVSNTPVLNLRDVTDSLKDISNKDKNQYSCFMSTVPSPMEVVVEKANLTDPKQQPSLIPLDSCEPVDSTINAPSYSSDAIQDKM